MDLRQLPAVIKRGISTAALPDNYEAAIKALAECVRIDECKEWADRHAALQAYGRQTKSQRIEDFGAQIRARAERRMGELIEELYPRTALKERSRSTGLSSQRVQNCVKVANVPQEFFEHSLQLSPVPGPIKIVRSYGELMNPAPREPLDDFYEKRARKSDSEIEQDELEEIGNGIDLIRIGRNPQDLACLLRANEDLMESWLEFADFVSRTTQLATGPVKR